MSNIRESLPGGYKLLAHLYAAESLILQDKVGVMPNIIVFCVIFVLLNF